MNDAKVYYGGVSGAKLSCDSFDLGCGVEIKQTFAHLMSPYIVAFSPPGPAGYHPAPWKSAKGGYGIDVEIEIIVSSETPISDGFEKTEIIWWITALIRLAYMPFISVPVISDSSFSLISEMENEPVLHPFEVEKRIFRGEEVSGLLCKDKLNWVKANWVRAGRLLIENPNFYMAFKAFDSATVRGRASASLLALWGGLEQLFSPSQGELRFRMATLLAAYIEPPGQDRRELYKHIKTLYDKRSTAAHTAKEIEIEPLLQTYVLMRNAIMKIIENDSVPTQDELERLLFEGE